MHNKLCSIRLGISTMKQEKKTIKFIFTKISSQNNTCRQMKDLEHSLRKIIESVYHIHLCAS